MRFNSPEPIFVATVTSVIGRTPKVYNGKPSFESSDPGGFPPVMECPRLGNHANEDYAKSLASLSPDLFEPNPTFNDCTMSRIRTGLNLPLIPRPSSNLKSPYHRSRALRI